MKVTRTSQKQAFSLVELSVVLVILGLLVGSVLSGQSLVHAAELRSLINEFQRYQASATAFQDKYLALPGDMPNASDFWGAVSNTAATCKTTQGTGTKTCNGDGSGQIMNTAPASNEPFRFWQQLTNAGLIEGSYTGIQGTGGLDHAIIGTNVPMSKFPKAGWSVYWLGNFAGDNTGFACQDCRNVLFAGGQTASSKSTAAALKPDDAWNIDSKLDDGAPATGSIMALNWTTCTNATTLVGTNSAYLLSVPNKVCGLTFKLGL